MPFSRFVRMPAEKRERLLTIAAREFATNGFEAASLNHILEAARIGKSSAYYYFEDKADLFATVAAWCVDQLRLAQPAQELDELTAEAFWPAMTSARTESLLLARQQPWLFGAARAVLHLTPESLQQESLANLAAALMSGMSSLIARGQHLELIRTDLPAGLLQAWFKAIDGASDDWLLSHLGELDEETIRLVAEQTVAAIQRMLAPPSHPA